MTGTIRMITARAGSALGAELTQGQAALRVFLAAGGLVVLGAGLLFMTVWWWRGTRPEPPALGPLEVMSDRKWMTAGASERRRIVEEFRPEGAVPMRDLIVTPVPIDLSELARDVPSFEDLRDVSLDSERPDALSDPEHLEAATIECPDGEREGADVDVTAVDTDGRPSGAMLAAVPLVPAVPLLQAADLDVDAERQVDAPGDAPVDAPFDEVEIGAYDATIAQPRPRDVSPVAGRD